MRKSSRTGSTGTSRYVERLVGALSTRKLISQKERERRRRKGEEALIYVGSVIPPKEANKTNKTTREATG